MPHGPHRHSDIASQAGLSVATVDRVLHGRTGVSARAVRAVEHAMLELDRQQTQLRLGARSVVLDLVIQAPDRFSSAVRQALEAELPALRPATVRARFHQRERGSVADLVRMLDAVGRRGRASDGVLLKAPDVPEVVEAIAALDQRGIPVVTLVTDVRGSRRLAYLGPDNAGAGATAAHLVHRWVRSVPGCVVVTLSRTDFFGERERLDGFRSSMAESDPDRDVVVLADADGLDDGMTGLVRDLVAQRHDIAAVYSAGGGNRGIASVLAGAGLRPVHLGHDLDDDNLALLRDDTLDAVLHHDLRADVARAARQLLRAHRLLPGAPTSYAAPVQVVTPHNIPRRLTTP
jgi:LacI family transcriptional regulator